MPLTWSIKDVADHEELLEDDEPVVTEALVFFSMVIESGGITDENVGDWCAVVAMYQKLYGPLVRPEPLNDDDIIRRIGLTTNAGGLGSAQIRKHGKRLAGDFMVNHRQEVVRDLEEA